MCNARFNWNLSAYRVSVGARLFKHMMQHSVFERFLKKKTRFEKNVTWTVLFCRHRYVYSVVTKLTEK